MRPWRPARVSASSLLTRSTTLKKRPRAPRRMQARDGDGGVALSGAGAADQHDVALLLEEAAAGEVAHQRLVHRRRVEVEVVDVLGQRQLGDRHLVLDRPRLFLVDLGLEEIADHPLRLVLPFHGCGDDLVVGAAHAKELELAHGFEDFGTLHQIALLRLSYRVQSATGAHASRSASGVMIVTGGPGSRRRARMFRITSAEWTPSLSASAQAASTAGSPSVSTAPRISTICRSPSGAARSLRRTRSMAAGSTQCLNGAPLRRAPGLRASTGT